MYCQFDSFNLKASKIVHHWLQHFHMDSFKFDTEWNGQAVPRHITDRYIAYLIDNET